MTVSSPSSMRRFLSPWLLAVMLLGLLAGGLGGLVLAGTPILARLEVARVLQRIANRTGFTVEVGRVRVDLRGRLVLDAVRATGPSGSGTRLQAAHVGTRIHAGALLRGIHQAAEIDVSGLAISIVRGRQQGGVPGSAQGEAVTRLRRMACSSGGDDDLPELWRVAIDGGSVVVMDPDGHVTSAADGVRALIGRKTPGAAPEVVAHGRVRLDDQVRVFVAEGTVTRDGGARLSLGLDRPITVGELHGLTAEGLELSGAGLSWRRVRGELDLLGALVRGTARALAIEPGTGGALGSVDVRGLDADLVLPEGLGAPRAASSATERPFSRVLRATDATLRVSLEGTDKPSVLLDKMDLVARARGGEVDVRARQVAALPSGLHAWTELTLGLALPALSPRRAALRLRGLQLADLARELGAGESVRGGEADVVLEWEAPAPGSGQHVGGAAELRDLRLEDPRLGPEPVVLRDVHAPLSFERRPGDGEMIFDLRGLSIGDARLDLAVAVTGREGERRLTVRANLPRQACGAVLGAIPGGLVPSFDDGALKDATGTIEGSVGLQLDTGRPGALELTATGAPACDLPRTSAELDARLGALVPEALKGARDALDPAVVDAFIGLLDPTFRSHFGVGMPRLERTIRALAEGRPPARWATSLTERLVEAAVPRDRATVAGRVELALLAMRLERLMTKDQIASEALWGFTLGDPDTDDLAHTAHASLGKAADELTPLDVAYLVALEERGVRPPPVGKGVPDALRDEILAGMRRLLLAGLITPKQFVDAAPYDPLAALDR